VIAGAVERNTDENGTPITVVCDVNAPAEILADPDLLGMALDALIDNARRYDPSTQAIELSISSEAGHVRFAIADHGPGVHGREKELIFEKYYRSPSAGRIAGTGLGLHLVKTIAHLHGGEVSYRDRHGGGAIFVLSIPVTGSPT
jgi:signal transduction histidine kinase